MILDKFSQILLTLLVKSLMILSKLAMSDKLDTLRFLMDKVMSLMKAASSSLSLMIEHLVELTLSLTIEIVMVRGTWSDVRCYSVCIEWLFNSLEPLRRNIRSMTEFESLILSEYLVETWLVEFDKSKLIELVIMRRSLLIKVWWGNDVFYKLSLILKLLVIIKRLQIFTSVFLRYFKAV